MKCNVVYAYKYFNSAPQLKYYVSNLEYVIDLPNNSITRWKQGNP